MLLRKATSKDIGKVRSLLQGYNIEDEFLPEEFLVAEDGGIVGCVRLKRLDGAYELCSLAVERNHQGKGVGKKLVKTLLAEEKKPVYCLTFIPEYFIDKGFEQINKNELPSELAGKASYCNCRRKNWVAMVRR